jgi:C1A family cysteine protease
MTGTRTATPLRLLVTLAIAGMISTASADQPKLSPAAQQQKLAELRKQFAHPKYKFKPVLTSVSNLPLASITGLQPISDQALKAEALSANAKAQAWLAEEKRNLGARAPQSDPSCARAPSYDLRKKGLSSPVQDQGQCGSCWDFGAIAAFESSWKLINGEAIGASEQQILNCARAAGSCGGGIHTTAFLHLMFQAIPKRQDVPYVAQTQGCNIEAPRPYSASIFAFVGVHGVSPTPAEIKQALCNHGALATAMNATEAFQYYGNEGDILNEMNNAKTTNHVVTIIGWDDAKHAWLIKNSWGTGWGIQANDPSPTPTRGYAWIDWDSNLIGHSAAWVRARKACPNGGDYDAGLCYQRCKPGYHGLGPMCWENCPAGMVDDGATCRAPISSTVKKSYGRGVGTPMGCGPDEEQSGALCYPRCKAGYHGVGPVCWEDCRPGYHDDGATCRKDADIRGSDNAACPWYDKCGLVTAKGCSKCPASYHNDGCTCRIDVDIYGKKSYGRGVGKVLHTCGNGQEQNGLLCYPVCRAGYRGVGPVCWESCPAGYRDDGAFCTKGGQVTASKGYGRGVGTIPP